MYRYEILLVAILIAVFGMILPIGYYFINSIPGDAGLAGFRSSSMIEQHAAVLTAFVVKPIYISHFACSIAKVAN